MIPMLFCGVIKNSVVKTEGSEGVDLQVTEQTRRRLVNYNTKDDIGIEREALMAPKDLSLQRFRIEYAEEFSYFKPEITGIYTYTQYHRQRPTWYSGAMAQVMQVVGGYGRQDIGDDVTDDFEHAPFRLPHEYQRKIEDELINVRLPAYTGMPDKEGKFRCDYKFNKCHLVGFSGEREPWLIQIESNKAYAMPLPIVPATATEAFREYIEEVGDDEILELLDLFGGLPTGETFPLPGEEFQAWLRAGVIIELCDTSEFYANMPFYDACGWSTNSRGTEAFNTCWQYDSRGLIQASAYKMSIRLSSATRRGWQPLEWEFADDQQKREADAYLSWLYSQMSDNTGRNLAIKYKLRRHTVEEILDQARFNTGLEYWDALEMDPIAAHSASLTRISRGPVYWGLWMYPMSFGRLKFPALTGEGCESFIMVSPQYRGDPVRCDTIVHGCYVDDQLQVIKYFIDHREFFKEVEGNFEEYMIVGSWEQTVTTGMTGLMGYFYTTEYDDRQESPPVSTHTKIVGTDLGYSNAAYKTPAVTQRVGGVSRARYYQHLVNTETTEGFSIDVAVCVPVFNRDGLLYPYKESTSGITKTESLEMGSVADPTSYQLWTNDNIWHFVGMTGNGNKGEPYPKEGEKVYIDTMNYTPEADPTGFADSGDWLGLGGDVIDISGLLATFTSRANKVHHGFGVLVGGEAPKIDEYFTRQTEPGKSSGKVSITYPVAGSVRVNSEKPSQFYYDFSPAMAGGVPLYFYRDAIFNTIGTAQYANTSEEDAGGKRKKWGHTELADHKSAHHFIGVINE